MISTIYIERDLLDHPRVGHICEQYKNATKIHCERYTEVFNPASQSFRLQKKRPALVLARKHAPFVLETPDGYGVGGRENYYFSHMLNCIYDCRYCFLQGMYRSAHYVLFVNYEDFQSAIEEKLGQTENGAWFFSGYDCDSLALEPVTHFTKYFLPFFARHADAWIELRTKSTQIRLFLDRPPISNCVIAFSFTPHAVSKALEHKVPSVEKRLEAMARLQERGWPIGLRFDPLIYVDDYEKQYTELFAQVFHTLHTDTLHSVSLGPFRLPRDYYRKIVRLYPDEPLFAGSLAETDGMVSYPVDTQDRMVTFCREQLAAYVPQDICFSHAQAY
ncbi:MAG: radical SAM protein [Acidiferrobacterales bacterium]